MALTKEQVLHVARLANLSLTDEEVHQAAEDLGKILDHVAQLQELDTDGVPATAHVRVSEMPLRADVAVPGLATSAVLAESPRISAGGFAVPKFMDEE